MFLILLLIRNDVVLGQTRAEKRAEREAIQKEEERKERKAEMQKKTKERQQQWKEKKNEEKADALENADEYIEKNFDIDTNINLSSKDEIETIRLVLSGLKNKAKQGQLNMTQYGDDVLRIGNFRIVNKNIKNKSFALVCDYVVAKLKVRRHHENESIPRKYELGLFFRNGIFVAYYCTRTMRQNYFDCADLSFHEFNKDRYEKEYTTKLKYCKELKDAQNRVDPAFLAKENRIMNINPKINDSITKMIAKRFPGADCSKCLTRTITSEKRKAKYEINEGNGKFSYTYKDYYVYHGKIENKCNKKLLVVGIHYEAAYRANPYGIIYRRYDAKQVDNFEIDESDTDYERGMKTFLFGGELKDIDLRCINKPFDIENGPEYQFLRIVEDMGQEIK